MQTLCYFFALTSVCGLSFLPAVTPVVCDDKHYAWPVVRPQLCCKKCPPGEYIVQRSPESCEIKCGPCIGDRYIDYYNEEMSCEFCDNCNKSNMEYQSVCHATHNAVCRCEANYRCKDPSCRQCVAIPPTAVISPTLAPNPEEPSTSWTPSQPITDLSIWFLAIIALLCAGIALIVVTKIKPFLRWIKSKHGYFWAVEPSPAPSRSDDEEVSTPIQEVRGKWDV